jgi:hypothetical protein
MSETATAAPSPESATLRRRLVDELDQLFAPRIPPGVLARSVERAIHDLSGSVAAEALPEMAARLAQHRLLAIYGADQAGPGKPNQPLTRRRR